MVLKMIYIYNLCVYVNFHLKKGSERTQTEVKKLKNSKFSKFQSLITFLFERVKPCMRAHFFCIFNIVNDDATAFLTMSYLIGKICHFLEKIAYWRN